LTGAPQNTLSTSFGRWQKSLIPAAQRIILSKCSVGRPCGTLGIGVDALYRAAARGDAVRMGRQHVNRDLIAGPQCDGRLAARRWAIWPSESSIRARKMRPLIPRLADVLTVPPGLLIAADRVIE